MIRFLLSIMLIGGASANGQTSLAGRVTDEQGGGVPNAAVKLFRQDGAAAASTQTRSAGEYAFEEVAAGNYLLTVEHESFRNGTVSVRIAKGQRTRQDVRLAVAGLNQTVVVTASAGAQTLDEVSKPLTVISSDEVANRNKYSLTDTLTTTPGVFVQNQGGPGQWTTLSSRGLPAAATAILVDGMRLRDVANPQGDATSFLETMNLTNTERIEVLRGSGSSLYGTNAVGGVINLVTQQGGSPWHGNVLLEGGSLGMYRGKGTLSGGAWDDRLKFSGGLQHMNVMDGIDGRSPWRNTALQGFARYDLKPNMSLTGRFWGTDDFLGYGNSPTSSGMPDTNFPATGTIRAIALPQDQVNTYLAGGTPAWGNATFIPNVYDPDNRRSSHFLTTAAIFRHAATAGFNWEASYQRVDTARIYENGPVGVGYQPGAKNYGKYAGNIDTAAARGTALIAPWLTITAGYEFEHEYYYDHQDDNMPAPARVSTYTHARQDSNTGYVAAQLGLLNRRLQISLSGRAQSFRISDPEFDYSGTTNPYGGVKFDAPSALTGDASIAYFIPKTNTKIRAHGGNSYRTPGLYERFGGGFYGDWMDPTKVIFTPYGDPRLAPDRYNSADGGIDQYLFSDRLRFSGTYFYTRLSQLTSWSYNLPSPDPFGRPYGYMNGAGGISRGVETSVEARPLSSLTLNGSYTYVNARTDLDATVPGYYRTFNTPKHMVGLVVMKDWKKRLNTTFDLYRYSDTLNSNVYYGRAMSFPAYTKAGLIVGYDVWRGESRSAHIYTKIDNLFDQTYYVSGYRSAGITGIGGVSFAF